MEHPSDIFEWPLVWEDEGAKEGITDKSAHNNLNHNFEFQSNNNVHELLHPSQLDFDYTHDLSWKNPIDECQMNNGIAIENEIENNGRNPKLHMVERDVGLLKEVIIEIIRLMEKVWLQKLLLMFMEVAKASMVAN